MTKLVEPPPSVVGRLLAAVSWQHATYYHEGGRGREDVLTAEVFQGLDLLPRSAFLGRILRTVVHGADTTVSALAEEVEGLRLTVLPGDFYVVEQPSPGHPRLSVQPDVLIKSPSVFCMVEAKRIKAGSFQAQQLAREYLAVWKYSQEADLKPLLLLVLPKEKEAHNPREVRVSTHGAPTQNMSIRAAVGAPLETLLGQVGPGFPHAEELMDQIQSTIAYTTWDEINDVVSLGRENFKSGDASTDASVIRVATTILTATKWHGLIPRPDLAPV